MSATYFDLVDLIEQQAQIIKKQSETICKLVNEREERENFINETMNSRLI